MKKIILLLLGMFFMCGCTYVNKSNYEGIIKNALHNSQIAYKNRTGQGYSYYLPIGLSVSEEKTGNVSIKKNKYTLYMYVDLISYHNRVKEEYKIQKDAFYSMKIENEDKFGYLEINFLENKKYLIEIMYNYAKIEVIVDDKDINEMLAYAIGLISSISYNDTIIAGMIGNDTLNASEIEFNIFETAKNESNFIQYDGSSSSSKKENNIPDTDLIN